MTPIRITANKIASVIKNTSGPTTLLPKESISKFININSGESGEQSSPNLKRQQQQQQVSNNLVEKRASSHNAGAAAAAGSERTIGQYLVLSKLGQGGFGMIYRVRSLSKYCILIADVVWIFLVSLFLIFPSVHLCVSLSHIL